MNFFLDSADVNEVKAAVATGLIDGLTTNPTLAANTGKEFSEVVPELLGLVDGPVSLEVISTSTVEMVTEGEKLAALHENVVVKLPMTDQGIMAAVELTKKGIKTNVTLVFSPAQALLAAKAGATYVSPFVGRLHDSGNGGTQLIADIRAIYDNYNFETQILVASDRTVMDTVNAAIIGADVITLKYENFQKLFKHPLTDAGLKRFMQDWEQSGLKPLV